MPWVDVHMHLIGGRGDFGGAVENAVRTMDRFGIATAIILPPPQVDSQPSTHDHTSYASALRRHPGRFAFLGGGGTVNATIDRYAAPAHVTEQVKRDFAATAERILAAGASGFGEIASLHISATLGHPYEFVPADHPLLLVLAEVAARRGVAGEQLRPRRIEPAGGERLVLHRRLGANDAEAHVEIRVRVHQATDGGWRHRAERIGAAVGPHDLRLRVPGEEPPERRDSAGQRCRVRTARESRGRGHLALHRVHVQIDRHVPPGRHLRQDQQQRMVGRHELVRVTERRGDVE